MSWAASVAEFIAIFVAARLLKLLGTNVCSILILLAIATRFCGYAFIVNPYWLIAMESMHFFNFGIFCVLVSQKADAIGMCRTSTLERCRTLFILAPPGLAGTLQGVAFGVCFGLGRGIGLLVATLIYTLMGYRRLFLSFAVFNLVAAVVYGIYFVIERSRKPKAVKKIELDEGENRSLPKLPSHLSLFRSVKNVNEEPLLTPSSAI